MKKNIVLLVSISLLILSSCGQFNKVVKTTDYEYKYEIAKQYYAEGEYNRAALLIQDVLAILKGTDKGEESLFLLGMATYKARNYDIAVSYFRKYYEHYPRGLYTQEARFYCAMSLYNNIPEVRLDQTETYEAVTEFQNFLELYPESPLAISAQTKIFNLQDKLVEKEYLSAKLYFDLGSYFGNCTYGGSNYQACIITAENAMREFPYASKREDFGIMILRAKYELACQSIEVKKEERFQSTVDEYYGFVSEFPESKYLSEAKTIFEKSKIKVKETTVEENNKLVN